MWDHLEDAQVHLDDLEAGSRLRAMGSQSVHDVNEGFDFLISESGRYALVAGWQASATGCGTETDEPYGWAIRVFPPQ